MELKKKINKNKKKIKKILYQWVLLPVLNVWRSQYCCSVSDQV